MLRIALLLVGLALTVTGLILLIQGKCDYKTFLFGGGVLVIAVLCENWRYRRKDHSLERQWQQTGEKFEDPETGQIVEVQYDPVSGERRYVRR